MSNNIATFAQSQQIVSRFKSTQSHMTDLQRQISSGVKADTYAGYGDDAGRLQNAQISADVYQSYMNTIDLTQIDLKLMTNGLSETETQLSNVQKAINAQLEKASGAYDLDTIKNVARTALEIVKANVNMDNNGRYMFAGDASQTKPYENASAATSSAQTLVDQWLDGTLTQQQFTDAVAALTPSQLGYNASIASAGKVTARADDNFEMDYTTLGTTDGFKKAIGVLNVLANMSMPTEGVDAASQDDFYQSMTDLYGQLNDAITDLRSNQKNISTVASALDTIHEQHSNDFNTATALKEKIQSVDMATAIVSFQSYQTQLEASFRTTSMLSDLSLTNFITT